MSPPAVFGDSAIALHWVACALDAVRSRLSAYGAGLFETEQHAQPYEDLRRLRQEMDALTEQLSETLGPEHEAVAAFGGARAAVSDIVETLELLREPNRREVPDIEKFVEQTTGRVDDQRDRFDACRNRFMDAPRDAPGEG